MEETKVCKQCGEIKPLTQFRKYYKGKGYYGLCKGCESINTRAKYLNSKEHLSPSEKDELNKINELYTMQRGLGLKPPTFKAHKWGTVTAQLDDLLNKYGTTYAAVRDAVTGLVPEGTNVPYDLSRWLIEKLDKSPEYYDEIYDELVKTYRPLLHVKNDTFEPQYDMTYAGVLSKILERFTEYGDNYDYSKEE